ncbi:MAG: formylglycine-generating enzyme family protein [Gordonia sp. (in: high G+C Gram-positive bacteria)]|uniref:formylglycine-generating enzyme family protein n=1 Tax=Gordonia sp. (in: high G+C Gram-positive bacteria) TaxID=84139 RepID=UPI0039E6005D
MATHPCCTPDRGSDGSPEDRYRGAVPAEPAAALFDDGLIELAGGDFLMGSDDALSYRLDFEGPVRNEHVAPFAIAATTVTVDRFAEFVRATGHRTDAEVFGDSLVFVHAAVDGEWPAVAATPWWVVVPGADWRRPYGPGGIDAATDLGDHPVTHVSHRDALAFCAWAGARLPTESEWEYAARGGLTGRRYPWGDERTPGGEHRMNVWQGTFPDHNTAADGFAFTAPVRTYPPNGYGLYQVTGNVWEWTDSAFAPRRGDFRPVMRGGSYLCHESYCRRYRVSARTANSPETSTGHTGFRVASSINPR